MKDYKYNGGAGGVVSGFFKNLKVLCFGKPCQEVHIKRYLCRKETVMKNQSLLVLFLVIGVSIAITPSAQADFYSAATSSGPQGEQSDLAGDITMLFAVDSENARNLADVYIGCTESPQQGNWQGDPRTVLEYPNENYINEPRMDAVSFASFTPTGGGYDPTYFPRDRDPSRTPEDPEDPEDPPKNPTPEPAIMLILGLGAAGLLPPSYRRYKQSRK